MLVHLVLRLVYRYSCVLDSFLTTATWLENNKCVPKLCLKDRFLARILLLASIIIYLYALFFNTKSLVQILYVVLT